MLQRPIRQAIRTLQTAPSRETCLVCQCACTRLFPSHLPFIQRRGAKLKQSPATWRKELDKEKDRKAGIKSRAKRLAEFDEIRLWMILTQITAGWSKPHLRMIAKFVQAFAAKLVEVGTTKAKQKKTEDGVATMLDADEMFKLCELFGFDDDDRLVANIGITLHRARNDDYEFLGNALFRSASNAGNELVTVILMDNIHRTAKHTSSVLKERDVKDTHKALVEIANRGQNTRAAVLAGKIAHAEGDDDSAIAFWKGAVPAAVAASEAARKAILSGENVTEHLDRLGGASFADLSAPWVELSSVYFNRKDFTNLRWAVSIGCEQDDPNSHFFAAQLEKDSSTVKSGWFHHITKAATSGHVRAMHDLALWYAESGWPFLEDEPPDHIKPTPFDRFPPQILLDHSAEQSRWQRLQTTLGLKPLPEENASAQAFHSAAYPTTPVERFAMALEWLKVAMAFNYAPSFLAAAGLLTEKTLYSSAATPKEALELSDYRYTYRSRADYYGNKKIYRGPTPPKKEEIEIPNPFYNPEEAKRLTREIFYAKFALETHLHLSRKFYKRQRNKSEIEPLDTITEDDFSSDMGSNMTKWFRYPEFRELFMDDRTGRLIDKERTDARGNEMDLLAEAKGLCEEQKWDLYAEDGSLLYRHGLKKK